MINDLIFWNSQKEELSGLGQWGFNTIESKHKLLENKNKLPNSIKYIKKMKK